MYVRTLCSLPRLMALTLTPLFDPGFVAELKTRAVSSDCLVPHGSGAVCSLVQEGCFVGS